MTDDPVNRRDPTGLNAVGWIYLIKGELKGEKVFYVGSAEDVKTRFAGHDWLDLINDSKTTVQVRRVFGNLDVPGSSRGTAGSAMKEALGSQEQQILEEQFLEGELEGRRMLNKTNAANPKKNMMKFQQRHNTSIEAEWTTIKQVGKPVNYDAARPSAAGDGVNVALLALDVGRMYLESKRAQYSSADCLLSDEFGSFVLQEQDRGLFRSTIRSKLYVGGGLGGVQERLTRAQFDSLKSQARASCGHLNFLQDLVPGTTDPGPPLYQFTPDQLPLPVY